VLPGDCAAGRDDRQGVGHGKSAQHRGTHVVDGMPASDRDEAYVDRVPDHRLFQSNERSLDGSGSPHRPQRRVDERH